MNFFEHVISTAWKKSGEVAASLQRQAPGARMIGEFAVKQASKEAEKVAHRVREIHSSCRQK
jgi:hypothetical protein